MNHNNDPYNGCCHYCYAFKGEHSGYCANPQCGCHMTMVDIYKEAAEQGFCIHCDNTLENCEYGV